MCFHPDRIVRDADWHDKFYSKSNPKKSGINYDVSKVLMDHSLDNLENDTAESLGYMYSFQNLCEVNNIPYLQVQGCSPLMHKEEPRNKEFSNYIIESPYVDKIKKTFVGWPIDPLIGGYSMDSKLKDIHRISPEDTHPNAEGHEFITGILEKCLN